MSIWPRLRGPDILKGQIAAARSSVRGLQLAIEDYVEVGHAVWVRMRARGQEAHSGKAVDFYVFDVCRFQDGQLIEHWGVPDRFAFASSGGTTEAARVLSRKCRPAATVDVLEECFVVRDAHEQALGYFLFRRGAAPPRGEQTANRGRGAADGGQLCKLPELRAAQLRSNMICTEKSPCCPERPGLVAAMSATRIKSVAQKQYRIHLGEGRRLPSRGG